MYNLKFFKLKKKEEKNHLLKMIFFQFLNCHKKANQMVGWLKAKIMQLKLP